MSSSNRNKKKNQVVNKEIQPFKIIIIGEAGVGKSCMMMRYMNQKYLADYSATIGVEFCSKKVVLDDQTQINLQLWDTAGQESFRAIVKTFYRNSHAIFIVYNVAKKKSFLQCDNWLSESTENTYPDAIKVLVGAQKDRTDVEVSHEEGERYKIQRGYDYFYETSAKTGENIDEVFKTVAKHLYDKYQQKKKQDNQDDQITYQQLSGKQQNNKKEGGCC